MTVHPHQAHSSTGRIVDAVLDNFMSGILAARREGWCHVCDGPIPALWFLPDDMIQTPPVSREEKARRAERARRVDLILRGGWPR